jgi:hypothetical protein
MNIIVTTSEYIIRLRDLFISRIGHFLNPGQNSPAKFVWAEAKITAFTEERALHMLLDQGKTYREAELVISTMKEWGLPLEQISFLDFEVHGTSVWIKPD